MIKQLLSLSLFGYFSLFVYAQNEALLSAYTIPSGLTENANAVVRLDEVNIDIRSSSQMAISNKRIITVLNKKGNSAIDAYVYFDDGIKINDIQALVYDANGNEIKKIKRKDFKDVSAVDGGTLYSDSRVLYMDYTPITYPYTILFTYETITVNTAFIPSFFPLDDYFVSIEQSHFTINYPSDVNLRYKEKNFWDHKVNKQENTGQLNYQFDNVLAIKPEDHSPLLSQQLPNVRFAIDDITLEGVSGHIENWSDFGKWMYNDLIKDTQTLPQSTIDIVTNMTKHAESDKEKVKLIYQYVQDKTRYISVQVGIGGWKPFPAADVDKLGYGDCKGLTNYTATLLNAVGIKSNYTVIYAGKQKRNMEKDFASMQGTHVILSVPMEKDTIWLECTSQKIPFGFLGDFTDDRDALVITPESGEIVRTPKYETLVNTLGISGSYLILDDGTISSEVKMLSKGIKYDERFILETLSQTDRDTHYKNYWKYINNLSFESIENINDREAVQYEEKIRFKALNYGNLIGDRMLVCLNAFNKNIYVPDRYRTRTMPLKIERGFVETDSVKISLPLGFKVEALPPPVELTTKFGVYTMSVDNPDGQHLIYNRKFLLNDGDFPKEDYDAFREFYREVARHDNSKVSLIKS